jgi:hypothetical protein
MIYTVVSIRDRAADTYSQPMCVASVGGAVRSFGDEVNRKAENNQLNSHPEDFDMYELGKWDDQSAEFICGTPRQIAIGKDLKIQS